VDEIMKIRLLYKIFGSYVLIVTLAVAVLAMLITAKIGIDLTEKTKEDLLSHARIIAQMPEGEIKAKVHNLAGQARYRITLIDLHGRVVADSERDETHMDNHFNRSEIQEARIKGQGRTLRYSRTLGVDMLYIALPLGNPPGSRGYIRLSQPLLEVKRATGRLYESIYQSMALILIPILLIAFICARRITSPIRKIDAFAQKVRQGDLTGTLIVTSSDEIGQLAKSINHMVMEQQDKIRLASEESQKIDAAFAGMTEGVLILDGEGRVERCNRRMEDILEARCKVIVGQTPLEIFRNAALQEALEAVRQTGEPLRRSITLPGQPATILEVGISLIQDLQGGETKTILVFHDITRLKQLERMRADFVANVTHEIRTPLTAIAGFIETLLEGALEDKGTARRFLQTIADNAERMNRLVDDLLTLSSIELGEMQMNLESLSLTDAVKDTVAMIEAKARGKNIAITCDLDAETPPIQADRDKVIQILLNVIDNAVKFTPESGAVYIGASSSEEDGFAVIKISDTGIGIPKNELPKLGERFYRVDKTRSKQLGGTGLGLSIVRHLLKAHGGWMEIYSTPGEGTTVLVYFPTSEKFSFEKNA
jgi:two-component system phosphate regulon sensor histidine kinase PhoR